MKTILSTGLAVCLSFASVVAMAEAKGAKVSPETRAKMAKAHEDAAACLKSDKPLAECRKGMMASMKETGMMKGKGKMHHCMDMVDESGSGEHEHK